MERRLIAGLGNPGMKYEGTRHNLGFIVLSAMAKKLDLSFKKEGRFTSLLAEGMVGEAQVLLLLPMTYMNLSGGAIRKVCDYYKIPFEDPSSFLVVVDDVYIKFGSMRLRDEGSPGGHNGLKNIEEHLQTRQYARLKMGIGPKDECEWGPLEEYVLNGFTPEERVALPTFVERGVSLCQTWASTGWSGAKKALEKKELKEEEG